MYLLKKRGRFIKGWSYATGLGHIYSWVSEIADAHRFAEDDTIVVVHAKRTGASTVKVKSTNKELKAWYKRVHGPDPEAF